MAHPNHHLQVHAIDGLYVPTHDYLSLAQTATEDIWTYKDGGAGGTVVATVTITYTDGSKTTIANVART